MAGSSGMEQTVDSETPTRELAPDDLFVRLKTWFQEDVEHHNAWLDGDAEADGNGGAREDFEFVSGRQWNEEALATLRQQNRPASVFDRVAPMINAVCGQEVANRQEVRYIPVEQGDVGVNELLTSAAMWFRDQSDAEDEDSDAFRDCVIAGRGWTETRIDYETNPDGDPVISRIDPFEIFPDRDACKPNFDDAKRIWRVRRMSHSDAVALIPDANPDDLNADWAAGRDFDPNREARNAGDDYDGSNGERRQDPECVIVECQWYEREPFIRYLDPLSGQIQEMPQEQFTALVNRLETLGPERMILMGIQPPQQPVTQHRRVFRRAFIGKTILAQPPMPVEGHFTCKAITGNRDRNRNQFTGLVRPMKDPARWTNKLFSQIMNILNTNAKGGIMAERAAFEDDRQASRSWARNDEITWMNSGGAAKVMPKPVSPFPQGQGQMLEFAMGAMPLVTGINQEFLGMREANQPGVLEYQRKQAGLTILATLFDSLRRYRKEQGRLMLGMIQNFLSDGRLVRIAGKTGERYVPLLKDQTIGDYDVIVDDAPTAPNAKERNWAIIQQMLPILMPIMGGKPQLIAEALRNSPLPDSFTQAIVQAMSEPPPMPPPNPDAELQRNLAYADAVAGIERKNAQTENEQASALNRKAKAFKDMAQALPALLTDIPSPPMAVPPPIRPAMPPMMPGGMPQVPF